MYRRVLSCLLTAVLTVGVFCAQALQPMPTKAFPITNFAYINTESSNLNIRSGPGPNNPIVAKLPKDYVVEILSTNDTGWVYIGAWYRDGSTNHYYTGYCSSRYIRRYDEGAYLLKLNSSDGFVNIRSQASNSSIITTYPSGAYMRIDIMGSSGRYYRVYSAKTKSYGYVHDSVGTTYAPEKIANIEIKVKVLKDNSFTLNNVYISNLFYDTNLPFAWDLGIEFNVSPTKYTDALDADVCPHGYYSACDSNCINLQSNPCTHGSDTICKCLYNLYDQQLAIRNTQPSSVDIQLGLTQIRACAGGLAGVGGDTAVVVIVPAERYSESYTLNVRRIQHEISHLFGCLHTGDGGTHCTSKCIMSGGWDDLDLYDVNSILCDRCKAVFNSHFD